MSSESLFTELEKEKVRYLVIGSIVNFRHVVPRLRGHVVPHSPIASSTWRPFLHFARLTRHRRMGPKSSTTITVSPGGREPCLLIRQLLIELRNAGIM
ncbi:hypothetical protein AVEN_234874-1 [Araneus ventricosus]|uniref:Uncharacterized protein n=1 Tax=Araneus ventricosus TaxID=182803 RepID=A0A4Y2ML75_ARAVE|nr:hypothetical protein AVEN_234874-1 [Araneus ventricosus]